MNYKISVVIPMYNASGYIEKCLSGLKQQAAQDFEVILVDDSSSDDTVEKARKYPFKIITLNQRVPPARVRNLGAKEASGDMLLFVDADVVLMPDSIAKMRQGLLRAKADALSGFYTDLTPAPGFFSRFQNLVLAYRYSKLPKNTNLTCSFFCAIKKDVFEAVGGYDEKMLYYEDVEMGNRLTERGFCCGFDFGLKVTHLKEYTHNSLIRDYFYKSAAMAGYLRGSSIVKIKNNGWPLFTKLASLSAAGILLSTMAVWFSIAPLFFFICAYFIFSAPLLWHIGRRAGLWFSLASCAALWEVFLASFSGIAYGLIKRGKHDRNI